MTYNTTKTLDKLPCNYVDFGKFQDRFGQFFLVQKLFRLLGCEIQSVQEGRKQTTSTGTKLDNGTGRLYSVYSI